MSINIKKITHAIGTRKFFFFSLAFFCFESLWFAFSARYPQAFDEIFHFGLIQIYSHVLSPFLNHQPVNAGAYGAVATDPSYLYHYLMSFPFRIIRHATGSQTAQVVILRVINVILFGSGLIVFRKVLRQAGASDVAANFFIFLFIMIPIVPVLAGQINYDNLLFPMVALTCLLCFKFADEIKNGVISITTLPFLIIVGLLTSLVTYAYLPIFLGAIIFVLWQVRRHFDYKVTKALNSLKDNFLSKPIRLRVLVSIALILSLVLFFQRYGFNIVRYHSLNPDCAKILSVKECDNYSAWSYSYHQHVQVVNKQIVTTYNIFSYTGNWFYWMWYRLFFAVNGPDTQFANYPPLPLPCLAAMLIFFSGTVLIFLYRKRVFSMDPRRIFLLMACLLYAGTLFFKGWATYKSTGVLENMNGRYLLPIIPMAAPFFLDAYRAAFANRQKLKHIAAAIVLLMFIEGGGILTFIIRSDANWDWKNHSVVTANRTARNLLKYEVFKGSKYYNTKLWFFN